MTPLDRQALLRLPGIRVVGALGPDRIARFAAGTALVMALLLYLGSVGWDIHAIGHDPEVYRAAGQRLNDGHSLYELVDGDAAIPNTSPYWTGPLLSPPLSGILWRPLALLPAEPTETLWRIAGFCCLAGSVAMLLARVRWQGAVILFLAAPAVALTAFSGNLNAFIAPAMILAWTLATSGRQVGAGVLAALGTSLKLGPASLAVWLAAQRQWRAVAAAAVTGAVLMVVALVSAGPRVFWDYLGVASQATAEGAWPASIPGVLQSLGAPGVLVSASIPIALITGSILVFLIRRHVAASFVLSVLITIWSTPVVHLVAMSLLVAAAAPFAWSARRLLDPVSGESAV